MEGNVSVGGHGGPEKKGKPADSSLPTSHCHLPLPGTSPGANTRALPLSVFTPFRKPQKTQPSLLTVEGPEPDWNGELAWFLFVFLSFRSLPFFPR